MEKQGHRPGAGARPALFPPEKVAHSRFLLYNIRTNILIHEFIKEAKAV
jgi:hypothetical protein